MTEQIMPQSGQSVKRLARLEQHYAGQVATFRQRLARLNPDDVLLLLLDIGKNVHWLMACTAADHILLHPHRLPANRHGLERCIASIDSLIEQRQPALVILGHEPSGVYHAPWAHALSQRFAAHLAGAAQPAFEYRFFNTYQVKLARQQTHLRLRKTDPQDLAAMFDLALRGLGHPAYLPQAEAHVLRLTLGFLRTQSQLLNSLERTLGQLLDQLWPGAIVNRQRFRRAHPDLPAPTPLIQTRPLTRQTVRILLAHCPDPHRLRTLADPDILALYRHNGGRAGPALLRTLRTWLDSTLPPPPAVAACLAEQAQAYFRQYAQIETLIAEQHSRLRPLLALTPARHIPAMPGLGELDAVKYLAALGDVQRFRHAGQVWALAGFDPVATGSGDHPDRSGAISKRGDPALRDTLYQMGYRTALHYPPVGQTFLDALERGKSPVAATIHAAHRANRICFHLLAHDEPFQSQAAPALVEQVQRRWQQRAAEKKKPGRRGRRRR